MIDWETVQIGVKPKRLLHDLRGKRFGRLIVLDYYGISKKKQIFWKCICDCGNETIVKTADLNCGGKKSCGCYRREVGHSNYKYGARTNKLYHVWRGMKARCFNRNSPSYIHYGGRGITVCDEWANDFEAFSSWAMSNGYQENLSIDRIDVNGNYCPQNCRWATIEEQNNNKRSNFYITAKGKTQTLSQWCKEYNADRDQVRGYMRKYDFLEALERSVNSYECRQHSC